ncbi:hypothetical protein DFH07DRAFT_688543, partial [Mycena maculata]
LIVAYCVPEVQRVIRFIPELRPNAKSWQDAVSELRSLYGSGDAVLAYTVDNLRELCSGICQGPSFQSFQDAQAYLRRFTEISGYLREYGFLTTEEVQIYFVAGLPLSTRKAVEMRLPESNRGTTSPPTIRRVMSIIRDLLRTDSFE